MSSGILSRVRQGTEGLESDISDHLIPSKAEDDWLGEGAENLARSTIPK